MLSLENQVTASLVNLSISPTRAQPFDEVSPPRSRGILMQESEDRP